MLVQYGPVTLFAAFIVIHALADFPLQGDYLARQKTRGTADSRSEWIIALCAHSVIHAGGVWLATGSIVYGAAEFVLHFMIDLAKGERAFGIAVDQALHVACKLAYVVLIFMAG